MIKLLLHRCPLSLLSAAGAPHACAALLYTLDTVAMATMESGDSVRSRAAERDVGIRNNLRPRNDPMHNNPAASTVDRPM